MKNGAIDSLKCACPLKNRFGDRKVTPSGETTSPNLGYFRWN